MHILSLFPQILFLGPGLAPLLLRLSVGGFLLFTAWKLYKEDRWISAAHIIPGVLLVLGLYTQLAALVGLLVIGFRSYTESGKKALAQETAFIYLFCAVILLSLIFTGPGFFAIDLPL